LSGIYGFSALERCARDLRMPDKTGEPMWQKREADLAIASTGDIYDVKPQNQSEILQGRRQVKDYMYWLNNAIDLGKEDYMIGIFDRDPNHRWHEGTWFSAFDFHYNGHRVFVRYAGGGVAAYRTEECGEECDESELQKAEDPTFWDRIFSLPEKFSSFGIRVRFPAPAPAG
jgi:hypothetical protein